MSTHDDEWLQWQALAAAGIHKRSSQSLPSLGPALQFMTEVMKMMRRFCIGQHQALQDILRKQRLNKVLSLSPYVSLSPPPPPLSPSRSRSLSISLSTPLFPSLTLSLSLSLPPSLPPSLS